MVSNNLLKITNDESILTYPHRESKSLKKFYSFISENYKNTNEWFGIEESISDQIWFYGTFFIAISIMIFMYIFSVDIL